MSRAWAMLRRVRALWRGLVLAGLLASVVATAPALLPRAWEAARVLWLWYRPAERTVWTPQLAASDDPDELTQARLDGVPPARYRDAIEAAVAAGDRDLAESLVALSRQRDIFVGPLLATRVAAMPVESVAGDLWEGVKGQPDSPAGFGAAIIVDLMVVGDIRDLVQQAWRIPDQDNTVVALAAAGVVLTVVTYGTAGAAGPAKAGLSVMKLARRIGRLNPRLTLALARLAGRAVRVEELQAVGRRAARLDWGGAEKAALRVVDGPALRELRESGAALGATMLARGPRAALEMLDLAEDTGDLKRLGRLADARGPAFRGLLKMSNGKMLRPVTRWNKARRIFRRAELGVRYLAGFAGWVLAGIGWALSLAWLLLKLCWRIFRFAWRRRPRAMAYAPAG